MYAATVATSENGAIVTVAAISAVSAIAVALITVGLPIALVSRQREKSRQTEREQAADERNRYRQKVEQIHESTVNSHSTVLRDDVDELRDNIDALMKMTARALGRLDGVRRRLDRQGKAIQANSEKIEGVLIRLKALEPPRE